MLHTSFYGSVQNSLVFFFSSAFYMYVCIMYLFINIGIIGNLIYSLCLHIYVTVLFKNRVVFCVVVSSRDQNQLCAESLLGKMFTLARMVHPDSRVAAVVHIQIVVVPWADFDSVVDHRSSVWKRKNNYK